MKRLNTTTRLISAVLCIVMLLGVLPVIPLNIHAADAQPAAQAADGQSYVSLPITIRDYAADGMLFEYNEIYEEGTHYDTSSGVAPLVKRSVVGGADTVTETGTANGATVTIKRTKNYAASSESGRYLQGEVDAPAYLTRYIALSYSQTSVAAGQAPLLHLYTLNGVLVKTIRLNYACDGTTHKVVIDIGDLDCWVTYLRFQSNAPKGTVTNIYWMNGFETENQAKTFNQTDAKYSRVFNLGNTVGFGLLRTVASSHFDDMRTWWDNGTWVDNNGIQDTTFIQNGWVGDYPEPDPVALTLNSGVKQNMYGGIIRTDLVQAKLVDGKMVYNKYAVRYVAKLLEKLIHEPWVNPDNGYYNMWYTMGAKLDELGGEDLASKFRKQIPKTEKGLGVLGTYAAAKAKADAGNLKEYTDVTNCYEAAYFLLHSIYSDNIGYGKTVDTYNEIRLVQKVVDGKVHYVFDTGYDGVVYDTKNGAIYNSQTEEYAYVLDDPAYKTYYCGNGVYKYPFNPLSPDLIGDKGYGINGETYRDVANVPLADELDKVGYANYDTVNYNLALEGHAKFVYHYDEDLFFTFTGDDDVYLFINGVRVLDIGAAHTISKVSIDLNDPTIIEKCGLVEGEVYDFDFFYMERHGAAANFSIETNIKVVEPSMVTTKKAYQNGVEIGYNGLVMDRSLDDRLMYEFGLENRGEAPLTNLTFNDPAIGVYAGYDGFTQNAFMKNGIKNLIVTLYHTDGTSTVTQIQDEDQLKSILKAGIKVGEKITIYGFEYNVPTATWKANNNTFPNTVTATGMVTYANARTQKLTGVADFLVRKNTYKQMGSLHFYTGGHLDQDGNLMLDTVKSITMGNSKLKSVITQTLDSAGRPLLTEDVAREDLSVSAMKGAVAFTAGGYPKTEKVLQLFNKGTRYLIGTLNLAERNTIRIRVGSDAAAMLGDYGSALVLTDQDGNELGRKVITNPKAGWYAGKRTIDIPVMTAYNGPVYVQMDMKPNPSGGLDGVAIDRIALLARTADIDLDNAEIVLCSASGVTAAGAVNPNAKLNDNQTITYNSVKTGVDQFYYMLMDGEKAFGPFPVTAYTYAVADSVFVLDYNLPVDLTSDGYSFTSNDISNLGNLNPYGTTIKNMTFANGTSNYGAFTADGESLTYSMNRFMEGTDTIEVTYRIQENGRTSLTSQYQGVTLTQKVTVVPANVMYYEDDFTGANSITYVNTGSDETGNIWAVYDTPDKMQYQSPDQKENYGYDDGYSWYLSDSLNFNSSSIKDADPAKVQAMLDIALHGAKKDWDSKDGEYPAGKLLGDASNDTLHLLKVNSATSKEVMSFKFKGTGFEILSRTTWNQTYAVLTVRVDEYKNGKWQLHRAIPVISESIGGDLTQIPLVVLKNLPYGEYKVTVYASNARDENRLFYVDGVRIYQPLTDDQEALYYKADEANVSFTEIKDAISQGDIVYGTVSSNLNQEGTIDYITSWAYGNTVIEDRAGSYVLTAVDFKDENMTPYEQYMLYGPNNEIYLRADDGSKLSYIAFYVTKDANYVGERSIQVGAHLKSTKDNADVAAPGEPKTVSLLYGGLAANFGSPEYYHSVHSGTEQYFSIDVSCLRKSTENGVEKYLVIIGTNDLNQNVLALTNLKLNGYSILSGGTAAAEVSAIMDVSEVNASMMAAQTYGLVKQFSENN